MQYLANVLPVEADRWRLTNATISDGVMSLDTNGSASISLTHDDVQFTPSSFKVYIKYTGVYDELSPSIYARLVIKDTDKKYQVFTVPFQVESSSILGTTMQAELITAVEDFSNLIFQITAEEPVEVLEWRLFPSAGIETSTLNTIETLLPHFIYYFNEDAISVDEHETEIVNLPFAMGSASNLSNHLLFSYVASADCLMHIRIKYDGTPEPYTPITVQVQAGPGYVGIPHSLLQVQAAAHLISVTVALEASAVGSSPTLSIPSKAIRYTCEGRGILGGASGEYPHAEVSDTYDYPVLVVGNIQAYTLATAALDEPLEADVEDSYVYTDTLYTALDVTVGIPDTPTSQLGSALNWYFNSSYSSDISIIGDIILTDNGLTFNNGIGEGIAVHAAEAPVEDYIPLINGAKIDATMSPAVRVVFSTDGTQWYTVDENNNWQEISLTIADISASGILPAQLNNITSQMFKALLDSTDGSKFRVAVYISSLDPSTTFVFKSLTLFCSVDTSNIQLEAPTISFAISEPYKARVHWTIPGTHAFKAKVYYGETTEFGDTIEMPLGSTFCEISGLDNRKTYYFAVSALGYGKESALSNVVSVIPSLPLPRILNHLTYPSSIMLQWYTVGITYDYYNIYVGTTDDNMEVYDTTTEHSILLTGLPNNVEYHVAVTGVQGEDESLYSTIFTARPMLPVLTIDSVDSDTSSITLTVSHADYDGYVKYRAYYDTNPDTLEHYADSSTSTIVIPDLEADTQYYIYAVGVTETEESTPSDMTYTITSDPVLFTTLGHTGPTPPTQEDADAQYTQTVEVIDGIQKYTIPITGTYRIIATGAAGGKGSGAFDDEKCLGGYGAIIPGDFELNANDDLYILVGQKGTDSGLTSGDGTTGAGGGGTYVAVYDEDSTYMLFGTIPVRMLVVAGAGNGGGDAAHGGVAGSNALLSPGTDTGYLTRDFSGGGFNQYRNNANSGKSFTAGGAAATYVYTRSGTSSSPGFGGGGSNTDDGAGGGGGGYLGSYCGATFGGGSYSAGEYMTRRLNTERTNGQVSLKLIRRNT